MVRIEGAVTPYGDNDRINLSITGETLGEAQERAQRIVMTWYAGFLLERYARDTTVYVSWLVDGHRGQRKLDGILGG